MRNNNTTYFIYYISNNNNNTSITTKKITHHQCIVKKITKTKINPDTKIKNPDHIPDLNSIQINGFQPLIVFLLERSLGFHDCKRESWYFKGIAPAPAPAPFDLLFCLFFGFGIGIGLLLLQSMTCSSTSKSTCSELLLITRLAKRRAGFRRRITRLWM